VGGVGRFVSYAMTSTEGTIDGVSGGSWTDTALRKSVKIAPGAKTSYARVLLVGEPRHGADQRGVFFAHETT
jgi:hypothetical protein